MQTALQTGFQPTLRPGLSGTLLAIQIGQVRPLMVGGRKLVSAIGKTTVSGPIEVGVLGLAGDEQADLSVHGGLSKAVYALPSEHLQWWQAQRQTRGATLFKETLAPGYLGENLSLQGLLEQDLFIGDRLDFGNVVLRVTQPREPCGKFNAVMGYAQAAKDMVQSGRCGFYLAVEQPGSLQVGATCRVLAGARSTSVSEALQHKAWKHLR
ncbi:MOSC domain-containing protein [uncultured Limnohabitans sp.]|jgi:MOSC domain-containing protein YiiM|uniref:MOSC domain-containing protein n=1 Tax=uncultured Limnohabitans sp. TaxID=768543 RepID=UPI00263293D5|nr:MOSC domain-containing protein [uncultured Limnohabitans sp.]